ncbi:hypothetical protein GHYDROH2_27720 [Geobacter hydrogenophilus]|uniref:Uncharacterized protein n=3 Tax=Geobacter hydrogenophilus TaxID=40983 RepID=A0A9W6LE90_9BACT|nr:hypothetical protein GHYDROH2_27720 [Geobacter hydrogenophilus]
MSDVGPDRTVDSNGSPALVTLPTDTSSDQTIDFGYVSPCTGSIGDFVWLDMNRDGIQNDGPNAGINGVTVRLYNDTLTTVLATTTSGPNGYYQFSGLCAGTYQVVVDETTLPPGLLQTDPLRGTDRAIDSNGSPASVTLPTDSSSDQTIDFGYVTRCTGSIGDYVWLDQNFNSLQDAGEPGIDGVTINLRRASDNSLITTTTTGPNGFYQFTGLCAGDYRVESVTPLGLSRVPLCSTDQTITNDSNCSPAPVTLATDNSSNQTIDFGFESPCTGTIGDYVWNDRNVNGIQDAGEPGINGVVLNLRKSSDNSLIATTTTITGPTGDGYYQFNGLCAGSYKVEVITPTGYLPTTTCSADQTIGNDSNCNPAQVDLAANFSSNETIDFGFFTPCTGSIGDFVWNDLNHNGVQDAGEPGLSGVPVTITGTNIYGTPVNMTVNTNTSGMYQFTGLCQGTYTVTVPTPAGYTPSPTGQGTPATDSNGSPATVTLPANNSSDQTIDFGFFTPCTGSIGDFVWNDLNHNGVQDAGEPGLSGVPVTITGTNIYGTPVNMTVNTNTSGMYQFTGLCQGTYTVTVPTPAGYTPSPTGQGTPATDSNGSPATVTLPANNSSDQTIDFGFFTPCTGSIGDFVWNDLNHNGVQDAGEPGLSGVPVTITGTNIYGTPVNMTVNTNTSGMYQFTGLCQGTYTVTVPTPAGYTPSPTGQGTPATDSNGSPATVTLPANNSSDQTIDFGFFTPCTGSIGDFVWNDLNHNGVQDAGEPGLSGVPVTITGTNIYGTPVNMTVNTNTSGMYQFTGLCQGTYTVTVPTPAGYTPSPTGQGTPATDSNGSPATVTLPANNSSDQTIDFGFFTPMPLISIKKYTNGDDADLAPGPYIPVGGEVKWEYVVTNTGNVDLTNVVVTDDKLGAICTIGPLAVGASQTCTKTGTAVMGQYVNMGTVTGTYGNTTVTDQNPSHYFGVKASIDIRKQAEGPDTRSFAAGSDVPFAIVVTNTGNVALNNVKVTDQLVPACNTTIGTLNPGQVYSYTCTAPMVLNGFTNTACTEGMAGAVVVTDCDDSTVTVTTTKIDIAKYVSIDGKTWFHTDSSDVLKVALCATCEEDYDKEHCDYNHDGKCDEKDVDYCKSSKYDCDRHDSEHGSNKRKHRCDDSSNKSYCEDKAEDAHERDHSDYNNDGKCDERDIDYCRYNKSTCDRHDADHHSATRSYRCDDSSSKTTCESKKKDEEKSDKERSDYNRDGKCDERDVAYCQSNKSSCDSFDRDRGNLKRRFRCDDSTSGGKCEDMARTEHEKDDGDYNNDGKCDERDIDYCKYNRSACDQHDKNHGSGKRTYRCDDSSNESSCEDRVRKEHDHDRSDYDHNGKLDEDDIKYCQENKDRCVKQDRDYSNCKRTYRCDDSEHREDCGSYSQREHDKDGSDYNHDGKCDERDIDYCKNEQERCDEHDRDHKLTKRTYRCDDSYNKYSCGSYAQQEQDKDRSDYNRDGKRDERDIDYCKGNDEECIKHDKGHGNFTRSYRCDESSNKTLCESARYSQNKSDKDDSDYNRDGRCDERDISYCKYNRDACDKFDSDHGNRKRTYRCDDSSYKTSCQDKAEYEHDRDHADYNRDGKCDERDIDNCKNSPYGCDDHDRDHGDSKRHYRCDDSYDKTRCEERSREESDRESSCSGSGGYPSPTCGKVYFKYVVTNTGSTTLTNLTLTDDKNSVSSCTIPAALDPNGSFTCTIGPLPAKAGLQVNTATATGTYGGVTTTDTDKGYYYGCDGTAPKSPGYWKNHPEAWPVESITIGGKTYTKAQAISLMNTPVCGDKTYTLFKALVAAKLDAMGCGDSSCVTDTIAKSDAWMALHPVGSGVAGDSYAWKQAEPWYLTLDDYINGKLVCGGSGSCTPPPPPAPTCGQCSGGTTKLVLKYTGDCIAKVVVKDSNGQTLFYGSVAPDSSFNFTGKSTNGTMGQYVKIYVNDSYKATIYTDCSKPIYPGMGIGSFTVVEGYSLNGGKFCRVSSSSCSSYDDDHYSSTYCGSHDGESSCLNFFDHESSDSHHDD